MHPEAFLNRLKSPVRASDGWSAQCPVKEDHRLTVKLNAEEVIVLNSSGGCTAELICEAIKLCVADLEPPGAKSLRELERHLPGEDVDELLKERFLYKGGSLLLVAPTGIGKSSALLQMLIRW